MNYKNNMINGKGNYIKKTINNNLKLYNSKSEIKKVFSEKIKFKLNDYSDTKINKKNNNNILKNHKLKLRKKKKKHFIKLSFSKNSQTILKKYDYSYNKENSFYKSNLLKNKIKLSHSSKEMKKMSFKENSNKKKIIYSHKTLNNIYKKKDNNINNINNYKFLSEKYLNRNYLYKNISIFNKSSNEYNNSDMKKDLLNNENNKDNKDNKTIVNIFNVNNYIKKNKKKYINLKNNITYMRYNKSLIKNNIYFPTYKGKIYNWKNNILDTIINNITSVNKNEKSINFYDKNYNHKNIKIYTILDLNKKNNNSNF